MFSFQGIRRQPSLGRSYFTLGVLCKRKGTLARIRQPNANNPHLGETVHSYPSKHKHLLLTHSKQTWPMRPETSPVRCLQNLILYYHRLTAHGQKATAELLMGKWHWSWTLNRFQNFYNQNLTHRPTQIHAVIILLFLGRQPNDTRLSIPNSRNLPELIKLVS